MRSLRRKGKLEQHKIDALNKLEIGKVFRATKVMMNGKTNTKF